MASELLLEIGTEELPASFLEPALSDLERLFREGCAQARLGHGELKTFGTPRRLALLARAVAPGSPDATREVLGPSARAAFGPDGKPTRAAEKFAESQKLGVAELIRVETPKGQYLAARVEEKGRPAAEILKGVLHAAVHGISFKKSMRWGDVDLSFARPVHWLVALLGEEVLPVVFADVRSGRVTFGHRFLASGPIELRSPQDYERALEQAQVIPDIGKRKKLLLERVRAAAERAGGKLLEDPALADEVTNLVELPCPVAGSFEERHLDLPPEVLIQEMKHHQRYFSVVNGKGKLLPRFVAVSNTPVRDEQLSLRGYERVLKARLSDGRFFFDEDRRAPLADRLPRLERVVWQGKLGSYAEKVQRIRQLAAWLAQRTGHQAQLPAIDRAALLCKADLVTGMVGEFPELQGVMGREYARASGEPERVAVAIYEHYLPRGAQDALPATDEGALIGLADRFDSLCGIFAIGKVPTGAADPFALRRACLAIINITLGRRYRYRLSEVVAEALGLVQPKVAELKRKPGEPPVQELVLDFFRGRLRALWGEGRRADLVEAVLSGGFDDLVAAQERLLALSQLVGRPDFAPLAVAFKRVVNIVEKQAKDVGPGAVEPARLAEPAEKELHQAFLRVREQVQERVGRDDFAGALGEISSLKPAVDAFFDQVMVMAEERELLENRVRLLTEIGALFGLVADFSRIQVEQ